MRGLPAEGRNAVCKYFLPDATSQPAADTAAVVTLAAAAGVRHVIRQIDVDYIGGTPTAAGITVTINGVTVWKRDLPLVQNNYTFPFPWGLYNGGPGDVNQAVVVTATDPGAATGCVAKLNVFYE